MSVSFSFHLQNCAVLLSFLDDKHFAGMSSRFDLVCFDDFTEMELESVWKKICKDKMFHVHDKVSSVVRRRLSKQRGREGFANARAVRSLFEKVSVPASHRYRVQSEGLDSKQSAEQPQKRPQLEIIVEDVIGERPNRDTNAKVKMRLLLLALHIFAHDLLAVERYFGRS
jgi:hypothetical protein